MDVKTLLVTERLEELEEDLLTVQYHLGKSKTEVRTAALMKLERALIESIYSLEAHLGIATA